MDIGHPLSLLADASGDIHALGNADLARVRPRGDVPMGAFTSGPAQ